ncbi:MAG: DUF4129 domain-containing protein [Proteobacteria bacterium]|nr:DUF4129 domain-containing protein [Pseudomonadota bacterium]
MASGTAAAKAAAATDSVAAAHARLLHDKSLQFDFPSAKLTIEPVRHHGGFLLSGALAPIAQTVFWGGVIVIVGLLLFYIGREVTYTRWPSLKRKTKATEEQGWRPTEAQARALLEDADRLAREGRFAEAVRLILFRSIQDIQSRRPHVIRPALTSRDIARDGDLPDSAREAFSGIAAAVEHSHFAGHDVDADGYAECRRAYEAFAFPAVWA